jgi:hypothetical protein
MSRLEAQWLCVLRRRTSTSKKLYTLMVLNPLMSWDDITLRDCSPFRWLLDIRSTKPVSATQAPKTHLGEGFSSALSLFMAQGLSKDLPQSY